MDHFTQKKNTKCSVCCNINLPGLHQGKQTRFHYETIFGTVCPFSGMGRVFSRIIDWLLS